MSESYRYEITGWRDGRIAGEWYGDDEVLARDACRELFARGGDGEVYEHGRFVGWVERGGGLPRAHTHEWGAWQDDPAGVVRRCACGALDRRPEG